METIARYVNLEKTYFSRLFHQKVGCGVAEYILNEKVKVAQNMLAYSEFSCTEIAQYLAFPLSKALDSIRGENLI